MYAFAMLVLIGTGMLENVQGSITQASYVSMESSALLTCPRAQPLSHRPSVMASDFLSSMPI